jgi:hypothetical protein
VYLSALALYIELVLMACGRYISNIEMPGGKIVYVPMHPPKQGAVKTSSAADWIIDFAELERAITPRTKMIVLNTPRKLNTSLALRRGLSANLYR